MLLHTIVQSIQIDSRIYIISAMGINRLHLICFGFIFIHFGKSHKNCWLSYYALYAFEIMSHHASRMTFTPIKMMQIFLEFCVTKLCTKTDCSSFLHHK